MWKGGGGDAARGGEWRGRGGRPACSARNRASRSRTRFSAANAALSRRCGGARCAPAVAAQCSAAPRRAAEPRCAPAVAGVLRAGRCAACPPPASHHRAVAVDELAARGRRRPGPRHRGDAAERGRARAWGADRRRDRAALRVPLRAHNPRRALPRSPACAQPAGALHDSEEGARHCLGDCVGPAAACSPRPEAAQGAGHDGRRAGPPRLTLRGAARSCPPPRIARSGKRAARAAAHIAQASIFWVMMGLRETQV